MRHSHFTWPWRYAYAAHQHKFTSKRAATSTCCNDEDTTSIPTDQREPFYESRWSGLKGGRSFGVRRPLRYLTYKLDLDESQTRKMAAVLNQLKTEREQAEVDDKRAVANLANLLNDGTPPMADVREALSSRVTSAETLAEETAKAVVAISTFLDDDQREEFVSLLLTGAISL